MMRAVTIVALSVFGLSFCEGTKQAVIGEAIEMGPYTFSVISATQGKQWESAEGTYREIVVRIRLQQDDSPPFTDSFSSSFIDSMAIVDAAGNSVRTGPAPVSPVTRAGRLRSEYYQCVFRYSRSSEGVRDFAKIGSRPQDFKLLIANPAREDGQPYRVAIQLG
jgi:hypothetical protein